MDTQPNHSDDELMARRWARAHDRLQPEFWQQKDVSDIMLAMPMSGDRRPTRAERQRQADNSGRRDRVAELAAVLEAYQQRARWSLTVEMADRLHRRTALLGSGVDFSGDHRPEYSRSFPRVL